MPSDYAIQQGDHIARIAARHGFRTLLPIWDHPKNLELRTLRGSPHVLLPGDVVHIPDLAQKLASRPTGQVHVFRLRGQPLLVRMKALDHRFRPVTDLDCHLDVAGPADAPRTDAEGIIGIAISPTAERGQLRTGEDILPVLVGHLDPVGAPSGAQARLNALGYEAGDSGDPADPDFRSAIEELQCDVGLVVSGELDADTLQTLVALHGC
ncbi:MAG: peptidoglycan-binding domain-containing protein [Polyangiaceae bacterium]